MARKLLTLGLLGVALLCDAPPGWAAPAENPAARLERLKRAQGEAFEQLDQARARATTAAQRDRALAHFWAEAKDIGTSALDLAKQNAGDPVALDALLWLANGVNRESPVAGRLLDEVFDRLSTRYVESDKLTLLCRIAYLTGTRSLRVAPFLQAVVDKNPHRQVRGTACVSLGRLYQREARFARIVRDPELNRLYQDLAGRLAPEAVARLKDSDPAQLEQEAVFFRSDDCGVPRGQATRSRGQHGRRASAGGAVPDPQPRAGPQSARNRR